ncbi:hypothetical protein E4U32_005415 [Claviceps aff. humidiphila group G2b]|nr:hypothetical protein E4U32_005415 [Claviceps aff. humidiphila group G2b]
MSSASISLSQPPSARLGALHNPSQEEDSNSPVGRLSPQENADSNRNSVQGNRVQGNSVLDAEAEHGRKPHRRRPRVPEYIPRRRNHGELCEVVEGEDCDLTDLWEPDSRERDHLPPPELVYESFDEAIAGVTEWAKEHGLAYRKQKWSHSRHFRLLMTCHRAGKRRERDSSSVSKPRLGAASQRTDCKMKFFLVAVDYTQLDGQWRVKWCKNRASITHNHPPVHDVYSIASYRRSTRTNELRAHLLAIWPLVRDATQAMLLLKESFPQAVFTRQDVVNELRHLQRPQAGTPLEIEELSAEMEEKDYWYRCVEVRVVAARAQTAYFRH